MNANGGAGGNSGISRTGSSVYATPGGIGGTGVGGQLNAHGELGGYGLTSSSGVIAAGSGGGSILAGGQFAPMSSGIDGPAGVGYGVGGGGAASAAANNPGGDGSNGVVIVEEFY
jgi:hypothetical protein